MNPYATSPTVEDKVTIGDDRKPKCAFNSYEFCLQELLPHSVFDQFTGEAPASLLRWWWRWFRTKLTPIKIDDPQKNKFPFSLEEHP